MSCLDASGGQVKPGASVEDFLAIDRNRIHALTGPIRMDGAEPGDVLEIQVLQVEHRGWGWTSVIPGLGFLKDRFREPYLFHWSLDREIVMSRVIDAPRDLVWKAWTERDRLMQWFGPKGFAMTDAKLDFRPGGMLHYCLRSTDGKEMWGKFVYREIAAPDRIVWVNSFSDEKGNLTRHPFSPTWPLEMLTTTAFTEEKGKTTVTVRWVPLNPTPEESKTFDSSRDGMRQGWTGTFDQLAEYLAKN